MYRYDEFDATLVAERVAQFRGQVERRLSGELTEDQFKPLRLMNGLYLQLHAYMLRVAVPYGTMSSKQMRRLGEVARKYDRGYGHFTTRQNIQYNWPALVDVPDLLDDLADVEMHAIQTSGNCIRNVTSDQYAGATTEEVEDPRPYAEMIRQWSTFHPEFSFLPRKFKIAVTAAPHDRAAVKVHDIGLILYKNDEGETGFEVIVGGGLGRTPYVGHTIRKFLPKKYLLSYLEAILRVYNLEGRRDNIYKARIKILVNAEGAEKFADMVEAEWAQIKDSNIDLPREEMARINAYFAPPAFEKLPETSDVLEKQRAADKDFARWLPEYLPIGRGHPYVVRDARGEVVGTSSLTDFAPILQYAHLGWTAYAPEHWGSGVNAACKLLLLGHVFAHGYGRVKLQADMLNERSRAAMAGIGARFEGVVRREQPRSDGSWRDTAQFAVTVDDWPEVRALLEQRIARRRP